jgi:hypothetical protein
MGLKTHFFNGCNNFFSNNKLITERRGKFGLTLDHAYNRLCKQVRNISEPLFAYLATTWYSKYFVTTNSLD